MHIKNAKIIRSTGDRDGLFVPNWKEAVVGGLAIRRVDEKFNQINKTKSGSLGGRRGNENN